MQLCFMVKVHCHYGPSHLIWELACSGHLINQKRRRKDTSNIRVLGSVFMILLPKLGCVYVWWCVHELIHILHSSFVFTLFPWIVA